MKCQYERNKGNKCKRNAIKFYVIPFDIKYASCGEHQWLPTDFEITEEEFKIWEVLENEMRT
jgi:hypothetical protein